MAAQVVDWARKSGGGPASLVVIITFEVVAILICLPGYSTIEYASGALFGFFWGSVIVLFAKCVAAFIAYMLIQSLRDSEWGRAMEQRVQGSERGGFVALRLKKGIEKSSFTISLLVRCSPLPAWLSNYALPLAGVPFPTYMLASSIGMLPPATMNVSAGAFAAAVAASMSGGASAAGPGGIVGLLAVGTSILSSTLLVHQLSNISIEDSVTVEAGSSSDDGSPVREASAPEALIGA